MAIKHFAAAAVTAIDVQSAAGERRRPVACLDLMLQASLIFLRCLFPMQVPVAANGGRTPAWMRLRHRQSSGRGCRHMAPRVSCRDLDC